MRWRSLKITSLALASRWGQCRFPKEVQLELCAELGALLDLPTRWNCASCSIHLLFRLGHAAALKQCHSQLFH